MVSDRFESAAFNNRFTGLCSEVRPVLLQFRVVHVDIEELWEIDSGLNYIITHYYTNKIYQIGLSVRLVKLNRLYWTNIDGHTKMDTGMVKKSLHGMLFSPCTGHLAPVCSKALGCSCDPICAQISVSHTLNYIGI